MIDVSWVCQNCGQVHRATVDDLALDECKHCGWERPPEKEAE